PSSPNPALLTKQLSRAHWSLTYKIPNECAVEVGDLLHPSGDVGRPRGATGVAAGLFLVVVVAQHEAEQEAWHHNVPDAQHGEVAACGTGEQLPL
ncbi:hypothetical protein N307_14069, partial [Dryobates pubescens]